jgi:hypothetical protein
MHFLLLIMLLLMIEPSPASAQSSFPTPENPAHASAPAKPLTAFLTREAAGEPANSFSTETPQIYLRWQGATLNAGDKIRCIWIAEDVGAAAPANYHVDEAAATANEPHAGGIFTLTKPKTDWPEGRYRAEIYVGTQLIETLPFTIEKLRGD